MEVIRGLKRSNLWRAAWVVCVSALFAGTTLAAELKGEVTEPDVISAERFSRDVSAFYLGFGAGYGANGSDRFGLRTPTGVFDIGDQDVRGGYFSMRGGWRGVVPTSLGRDYVYGIELGYDVGNLSDTVSTQIGGDTVTGRTEISDMFYVQLRNGLTNRSGRVLYFVSVGYIWGQVDTTSSISSTFSSQLFEESDRRGGYTASIGAEHKLNDNWSITGEYQYVQFESKTVEFGSGFSTKSTPGYRGLRFGLNYTF